MVTVAVDRGSNATALGRGRVFRFVLTSIPRRRSRDRASWAGKDEESCDEV